MMRPVSPLAHTPALDGVRALAAVAVVLFHTWPRAMSGGFVGVDLFFVLSGFLITSILLTEYQRSGTIGYWAFMVRRMRRLLPAFYIFLVPTVAVLPLLFPDANPLDELVLSAAYLSNFSFALEQSPVVTQHSWSLAVEMHFYILWPLVVLALARWCPARLLSAILALYVLATVWRLINYDVFEWQRAYYFSDTRFSGLLLGAVIPLIGWRPGARLADIMALAAGAVLLLFATTVRIYDPVAASYGGMLVEIAALALILACLVPGTRAAAILGHPVLARLGLWSYGIYLWHYPIARITRDSMDRPLAFVVTLALSVALAALSYEVLERGFRKPRIAPA